MRYCFFSAQYLPVSGGVERYTHNLACELIKGGDDVLIVTSSHGDLPERETDEAGINILRMASFPIANGRLPLLNPLVCRRLAQMLDAWKPDRIVIQTHLYLLCVFGTWYAHDRRLPAIVIEHGSAHVISGNSLMKHCVDLYEHILAGRLRKRVGCFYAVSAESCRWLSHFGIQAQGTLYNAVPTDLVQTCSKRDFRAEYHCRDDLIVAFVGRLIPEKGIVQLCQAVRDLRAQGRTLTLFVAGDGPLAPALRRDFEQDAIFLGEVEHDDVLALLRCSDIYCLPSDAEGFPTALLEAGAMECALIATDRGGACEIMDRGDCGILLRENTRQAIQQALSELQDRVSERQSAAQCARTKVMEDFTFAVTCDKLRHLPCWEKSRGKAK